MSHAHPDPLGRYPFVSHEEQVINGVLLSGIMRTFRLMLSSATPASIPSVWMEKSKKGKLGLNYQQSVQDWGLAWLPDALMEWSHPPRFSNTALSCLSLVHNAFQRSFIKTSGIQGLISRENRVSQFFREHLRAHRNHPVDSPENKRAVTAALTLGANLIVQAYILDVFELLSARVPSAAPEKRSYRLQRIRQFLAPLQIPEERQGLRGLHYTMLATLLGKPPTIIKPRATKSAGKKITQFPKFNTGLWRDKVAGLFMHDEVDAMMDPSLGRPATDRRKWNDLPYRQKLRQFLGYVAAEFDDSTQLSRFIETVKAQAVAKLWIIARWDGESLAPMRKKMAGDTATNLERTGWLIPEVRIDISTWKQCEYGVGASYLDGEELEFLFDSTGEEYPWFAAATDAREEVEILWRTTPSILPRNTNIDELATPLDPNDFGWDLRMSDVEEFYTELDRRCATPGNDASEVNKMEDHFS